MIRTRRVWEDACLDIELSEVSGDAERLFWRMLSKTDDYGNLPASPKWLHGACVPLCGTTARGVEKRRDELAAAGLITLYEAAGREYAHFPAFARRQPFRGDYRKTRLYPGPNGEAPDNLAVPRAEKRHADKSTAPPEPAQQLQEGAQKWACPARKRGEKEKEKEKLPENLNEKKKEKEGTSSSPSENFDLENSPSHSPPSSPAQIRLVVRQIVARYRRCHPGAYVGEEKLRSWIETDLATLTSKQICEALESTPPALYYHDALRALRERVASAERHARTKAKYEQTQRRQQAREKP